MSAIASLYNVPQTPEELAQWGFAHMAHHRDIIRVIYETVQIALPEYQLDPIDPNNPSDWDYQHQIMHQDMNQILGIKGNDLTGVDFTDVNQLTGWIFLNSSEHQQAADILEIG